MEAGKVKLHFPDAFAIQSELNLGFHQSDVVTFTFRTKLSEGQARCHEAILRLWILTTCLSVSSSVTQWLFTEAAGAFSIDQGQGQRPGVGDHYWKLNIEPVPAVHSLDV